MEFRIKPLLLLLSACFVAIFTAIYLLPSSNNHVGENYRQQKASTFKAPKHNIWLELSPKEADDVYEFLHNDLAHLNLTRHPKSNHDNFIFILETLRPNKTDAIAYLHHDDTLPQRWAKAAIVQHDKDSKSYIFHYMVGPLPISSSTRTLPLTYIFNSGRNYVASPVQDFSAIMDYGYALGANISDITQDLLGATVNLKDPPQGLQCWPRASTLESGGMSLWFQFFRPGLGSGSRTILPQGLYIKVEAPNDNTSDWTTTQFYYNGQLHTSEHAFRSAWSHPDFPHAAINKDGPWTATEDFTSHPPGRELPPPVSIQPYGPRYRLDRDQQFVSWFGFEFYISTAQATGLTLFDIRFQGERVMYELGLQEALAHYAGDNPMQGGLEFLDSFFGMGKNQFEMVPGYDCPAYADLLDSRSYQAGGVREQKNSICVFEFTADYLLARHTVQYSVTASRNTFLVVRAVSTVGNYSYTIEYIFYLDGTIEVKVRASGFIFGAFDSGTREYGHRVHKGLASSMHDHVINFKADVDVAGAENEVVRLAWEPTTKSYPWDDHKERNTMHIVPHPVTTETSLDWPANSAEFYLIQSSHKRNSYNEPRAYRITPGTGMGTPPHLTIPHSTSLNRSAAWSVHDLWILRQKDREPRSADPLNFLSPHDPIVDFAQMADGESLLHNLTSTPSDEDEDEEPWDGDVVVYFNLGAHHLPHSGDVPNTLMHTSSSSVMFVPHNFLDRDASRASVQGVRVHMPGRKNGGGFAGEELRGREELTGRGEGSEMDEVKYFGTGYEKAVVVEVEMLEPDLRTYGGREGEGMGVMELGFNGSAVGWWEER